MILTQRQNVIDTCIEIWIIHQIRSQENEIVRAHLLLSEIFFKFIYNQSSFNKNKMPIHL